MLEGLLLHSALLAAALGLWSYPHRKRMFWCALGLLGLPAGLGGVGGIVLEPLGLAWRANVRLGGGTLFTAGIVLLFTWFGAYLWRSLADWFRPPVRGVCRAVMLAGIGLVCLFVSFWGMLLSVGLSGANDRVIEREGQTVVAECPFLESGYNYYAYYGPLVRGNTLLEGSLMLWR